jgi:hypothetical protein
VNRTDGFAKYSHRLAEATTGVGRRSARSTCGAPAGVVHISGEVAVKIDCPAEAAIETWKMRDSRSQETAGGIPIRLKRRTNLGSLSHWGIERGVNDSGGTKTEAALGEAAPSIAC